MAKKVVLFTASGCSWCGAAKNYFKQNAIKIKIIDISKDSEAAKDCQRHGCKGVPVVLIGSTWICGFDKNKIEKALS